MTVSAENIYSDGRYLANNPTWHEEDAPFKARHIARMLERNGLSFDRVAEVGCGTGAVLREVRKLVGPSAALWQGFDISTEAIGRARVHPESDGIDFQTVDFLALESTFDVLMMIDVFEHVPDYMGFLSACRTRAKYKIFHIPLDLHVSAALRDSYVAARNSVGHLHYFSESTARATLVDTGHRIVDCALTPGAVELFRHHPSVKRAVANVPRLAMGMISQSVSARLFGGYSLLVLAE